MSASKEKSNIGVQQCSFAQLTGASGSQKPCNVQQLSEDLYVCYGCERYSTAIPADCAGVFEEVDGARVLIASFISGEIASPSYRPLSLVRHRNNMDQHTKNAEFMDGDGVDPTWYDYMHLEFSGGLHMTVNTRDREAAEQVTPLGVPFNRDLVEAYIGTLGDEEFHAAEKLLANGWMFTEAIPAIPDQSYAHIVFWKGHERNYTHPDGTVKTVRKGIRARIEKGM
ncbi:MAG: hypothetical protein K2Y22_06535 [Candidatus Obscuribacterales bacterium]|nr:hypothetical protein [Candidatus Obscuribacterales bacterium]